METKIMPFDLETAKKIQAGEIKGKIINNLKNEVRIVCFDREDAIAPIIALFKVDGGEGVMYVRNDGHACNCRDILVLEVFGNESQFNNEPQFKPFDKVLLRDKDTQCWTCGLFSHKNIGGYYACGLTWNQCIPYEGNEHLVGTNEKPKA